MSLIAIGSDHAGYELKQHLIDVLQAGGHDVLDHGTHSSEAVDYPEICASVGRTVRRSRSANNCSTWSPTACPC